MGAHSAVEVLNVLRVLHELHGFFAEEESAGRTRHFLY